MSSSDHIHVGDTINGQYRVIDFGDEPGTIITKSMDGATVVFHLSEVTRHSSSHDWTPPAGYEKYLAPVVGQQEDEPMSNEPAQVATKVEQTTVHLSNGRVLEFSKHEKFGIGVKEQGQESRTFFPDFATVKDCVDELRKVWELEGLYEAQGTIKVEELSENLKHLDKPERRDNVCRSWVNGVVHLSNSFGYYRRTKANCGRNKNLQPGQGCYKGWAWGWSLDLANARLAPTALLRWFPVALENTIYSDAIVRHNVSGNGAIKRGYLVYSIANTRHYYHTTMRDKQVWYLGNKVR